MSLDNKAVNLADLKVSHDYLVNQDSLLSERINALGSGIDDVESFIGDLSDLSTTLKDNLVDAINEVLQTGGKVKSVNSKTGDVVLKTSDLTNDSGYLTSYTETDPTVPSWAKQVSKPTYTAQEVGASSVEDMNSEVNTRRAADAQLQSQITALGNGAPIPVETVAEMIDNTKAYLYTGAEVGWLTGYWYTYDSAQAKFVPRGEYGVGTVIDNTLTVSGDAADAKATGDAISEVNGRLQRELNYADAISDSENLFHNTDGEVINSTLNNDGYFFFQDGGRVVIIPCDPSTLYRVSKKISGRFKIGTVSTFPADRDRAENVYDDASVAEMYYTTNTTARYLAVQVYYNAVDGYDYESILQSVVIQRVSAKDVTVRKEIDKKVDATYGYTPVTESEYNAGVMGRTGIINTGQSSFRHCIFNVTEGETYKVYTPTVYNQPVYPVYIFRDGEGAIITYGPSDAEVGSSYTGEITAPVGAETMVVNCNSSAKGTISTKEKQTLPEAIAEGVVAYKKDAYKNKSIIFFGTSIIMPSSHSIPAYIGNILGCNIINKAYGSSCARRGWDNKITENDPYGWTGVAWQNVFRAMGANLSEKQDLIDNYATKWKDLLGGNSDGSEGDGSGSVKPSTLSEANIAEIKGCSYENLLIPYLDGTYPMPDLFVFEHGRNDVNSWYGGSDSDFVGTVSNENSLNRSKYGDVMYFYIQKIFEANPQAKVLIMSYYEHDSAKGAAIVPAQKQLAEYHGVYFCDVSNAVAWSQRKVTTTGYWGSDHIWHNSGGTQQTITRRQQALYDNLHPHSDYSGKASMRVAEIVAKYIDSYVSI